MANALGKGKPTYRVHIFNCDDTCNLDEVKSLFEAVGKKVEIKIEVRKHSYELIKTTTLVEKTIPSLKMDYAVLMVHARDNCPSFDDNRYGKIYKALKERTGSDEKLLIVIGGDEKYESKQEEEKEFISNCVLKKIGWPHFERELLDGRKSFMFSWNEKHRPIHEEAMMHFLDPRKRGQKFVCQEKSQAKNNPVTPNLPSRPTQETSVIPVDNKVENQGNVIEANASVDGTDSTSPQEFTELSGTTHSKGTVLLSTIMQNGAISYRSEDVTVWMDGRKWRVSDNEARRLQQEWRSSRTARLKLVADDEGKVQVIVKDETTCVIL